MCELPVDGLSTAEPLRQASVRPKPKLPNSHEEVGDPSIESMGMAHELHNKWVVVECYRETHSSLPQRRSGAGQPERAPARSA